jgi:hypothetical protein
VIELLTGVEKGRYLWAMELERNACFENCRQKLSFCKFRQIPHQLWRMNPSGGFQAIAHKNSTVQKQGIKNWKFNLADIEQQNADGAPNESDKLVWWCLCFARVIPRAGPGRVNPASQPVSHLLTLRV